MSTPEERLEQLVAEMLADTALTQPPPGLLSRAERAVAATRRWPRWYAALREAPMRYASTLAVGSTNARKAALVAATLLLAAATLGTVLAGLSLLTTRGPIVVDQGGAGDATTITAAVAMARDGDRILVRSGTYEEAVIVDKDVTIAGDGPRGTMVMSAPESGPRSPSHVTGQRPYALWLDDVTATVTGLTFRGRDSAVHVSGGSAILARLAFNGVGEPTTIAMGRGAFADAVAIYEGAMVTVADSVFSGGGSITSYEETHVIIEGNTLTNGPSIVIFVPAEGSVVRGNVVARAPQRGIGVFGGPSQLLIEDNLVRDAGVDGISVGLEIADMVDPIVRGNEISGSFTGISIAEAAGPTITDNSLIGNELGLWATRSSERLSATANTLTDNGIGIRSLGDQGTFEGNTVVGGDTGIQLIWGTTSSVIGNVVEGAGKVGLSMDANSSATVRDNHICDNAANLDVEPEAEGVIRATNEICEDAGND